MRIISFKVHCNQNKYIFTSFTARDRALYIFKELWKAKLQLAKGTNTTSGQNQTTDQKGAAMVQNLERTESEVQDPEFDIDDSNNVERVSNASQNSDENGTVHTRLWSSTKYLFRNRPPSIVCRRQRSKNLFGL